MHKAPHSTIGFADFELDRARSQLLRNGQEVRLRPRSMAVLDYLAENPNRLVTKHELLDAIWGQAEVTEGALTQCVIDIRRALGEHKSLLRTVPRRGYSLELESSVPAKPEQQRSTHWRWVQALGAVALIIGLAALSVDRKPPAELQPFTLLVAPMRDGSADQSLAHLSFGVIDELKDLLINHAGVRVVVPPVSADELEQLRALARAAGASHVLTSSLTGSLSRARVIASLTDVVSGAQAWSQQFDLQADDWLSLQRRIGVGLAASLQLKLADNDWRSTTNNSAWEHFQKGRFLYARGGQGDVEQALKAYARAVDIDPEYGNAWVGLMSAQAFLGADLSDTALLTSLDRALQFAGDSAETHMRIANLYCEVGREGLATSHYARAIELDRADPFVVSWLANRAYGANDIELGEKYAKLAADSDPLNPSAQMHYIAALMASGRFEEAENLLQQLQLLEGFSHISIGLLEARLKLAAGRFTSADEQMLELTPIDGMGGLLLLARAARGDRSVLAELSTTEDLIPRGDMTPPLLMRAEVEALLGDAEQAKRSIQAMIDQSSDQHGFFFLSVANMSPFLAHLRDDANWPTTVDHQASVYAVNTSWRNQ